MKNVVSLKDCLCDQKQSTKNELPEEEEDTRFKATSLSTGLKPVFFLKIEKHGSNNIEGFIPSVENPFSIRISDDDALNPQTRK